LGIGRRSSPSLLQTSRVIRPACTLRVTKDLITGLSDQVAERKKCNKLTIRKETAPGRQSIPIASPTCQTSRSFAIEKRVPGLPHGLNFVVPEYRSLKSACGQVNPPAMTGRSYSKELRSQTATLGLRLDVDLVSKLPAD
jgi:hypothetical protein